MSSSINVSPQLLSRLQSDQSKLRSKFSSGVSRPYEWRIRQLKALLKLVEENEEAICKALHEDLHKPHQEAYFAEVILVKSEISLFISHLREWMRPVDVPSPLVLLPGKSTIHYEPYGVALIISPFNYPVQLMLMPMVAAIAAGNLCCIKPSELTPSTEALVGKLLRQYLDSDTFMYVTGAAEEVTALLKLRWDYIFFTGSESVGRIVQKAAAEFLTPTTLELGGKSPTIVAEDADLQVAAKRIMWGKMMNAGQTCIAPDYVFVHRSVKAAFVAECKTVLKRFYGDDVQKSADFGRIVSKRHTERLAKLIEADQKSIVYGGKVDKDDRFVECTLLEAKETSKSMEEEIFGPILPILEYDNIKEVVKYINAHPKPLALYAFSNSSSLQQEIVDSTSSGGVSINDTIMHITNHNLPFGGVGPSGSGVYHGQSGFQTFSHRKSVLYKSIYADAPQRYAPYAPSKLRILGAIAGIQSVDSATLVKFLKYLLMPIVFAVVAQKLGIRITYGR